MTTQNDDTSVRDFQRSLGIDPDRPGESNRKGFDDTGALTAQELQRRTGATGQSARQGFDETGALTVRELRRRVGLKPGSKPLSERQQQELRRQQAMDTLQRQGLATADGEIDLVRVVQARAENIARDAGVPEARLRQARRAVSEANRQAQIRQTVITQEPAEPAAMEPAIDTSLAPEGIEEPPANFAPEEIGERPFTLRDDRRESALGDLVDAGLAEIDTTNDQILVDIPGAVQAGQTELLLDAGFSQTAIQEQIAAFEARGERLAFLELSEQAEARRLAEASQQEVAAAQVVLSDLQAAGVLEGDSINVVQALQNGVAETTLRDAGVPQSTIDAIRELDRRRLLDTEGRINAVLATQLGDARDEGLTPESAAALLRDAGLSAQDISNAQRLGRGELPVTLGTPTAAPIASFEPRTRIQLGPEIEVPDDPRFFPVPLERAGLPAGGTGLVGVAPGIPLRGAGRAALIAAVAGLAFETVRTNPQLASRLPSLQRQTETLALPGFDVRSPVSVGEITPTPTRVPPLGGFDTGAGIPATPSAAPAPQVERVLDLAIDADASAATLDRNITVDPQLTDTEKAQLKDVARRATEADTTSAVPIDTLIDQVLAGQSRTFKGSYARRIEELRAKQAAFADASAALVESQGFAPQAATNPATLGIALQRGTQTATQTATQPAVSPLTQTQTQTQVQPATQTATQQATQQATRTGALTRLGTATRTHQLTQTATQPLSAPLTGTAARPVARSAAQTAAQTATGARTGVRAPTRPLSGLGAPTVAATTPAVAQRIIPGTIRLPDTDEGLEFSRKGAFPDRVSWNQGVTRVELDFDTGARRYSRSRNPRIDPDGSYQVLAFDDDPPQARSVRMGAFDVFATQNGLEFIPNEQAAQFRNKPKPRKLRTRRL